LCTSNTRAKPRSHMTLAFAYNGNLTRGACMHLLFRARLPLTKRDKSFRRRQLKSASLSRNGADCNL
jgi:hypothetical protein